MEIGVKIHLVLDKKTQLSKISLFIIMANNDDDKSEHFHTDNLLVYHLTKSL